MTLKERQVSVVVNPVDTLGIVMLAITPEPGTGEAMPTILQNLYVDVVAHLFSDGFGDVSTVLEVDVGGFFDPWAHWVREQLVTDFSECPL